MVGSSSSSTSMNHHNKDEGDVPHQQHGKKKLPSKTPISRRSARKKAKDKPKRPMSAYNFFFKSERERIVKLLAGGNAENDPTSKDYIDDECLNRLRKDDKEGVTSPKFEELGKLIGQRWKALPPDRHTKFSELASEDTERYQKEMAEYNSKQEAKRQEEALQVPTPTYPPSHMSQQGVDGSLSHMSGYDMAAAAAYGGMTYSGSAYPGMDAYGYAGYAGSSGAYGGGYGTGASHAAYPTNYAGMMSSYNQSSHETQNSQHFMYGAMNGGTTGGSAMDYGANSAGATHLQSADPTVQGTLYGAYGGWHSQP